VVAADLAVVTLRSFIPPYAELNMPTWPSPSGEWERKSKNEKQLEMRNKSSAILSGRDIRELVFSFLDAKSIGTAAKVCKSWYASSSSQRLWHGLYTRSHGPAFPKGSQIVDWRKKFLEVDSAWEALIRSRRSIVTFFGPNALALLIGAVVVVTVTLTLVAQQHISIHTYQARPAKLHAWWIDRNIEQDDDSDELVVTYRLRLSLTQLKPQYSENPSPPVITGDSSLEVSEDSPGEKDMMLLEEADMEVPKGHKRLSPRIYPLSKDSSGTLEEQLALLEKIHPPSFEEARGNCKGHIPPPGAAPHPWRRWCGGRREGDLATTGIIVFQPSSSPMLFSSQISLFQVWLWIVELARVVLRAVQWIFFGTYG
ncbi:hypothetical protein AAMO2058_001321900, partial [Amorphochlora amoebiformis]